MKKTLLWIVGVAVILILLLMAGLFIYFKFIVYPLDKDGMVYREVLDGDYSYVDNEILMEMIEGEWVCKEKQLSLIIRNDNTVEIRQEDQILLVSPLSYVFLQPGPYMDVDLNLEIAELKDKDGNELGEISRFYTQMDFEHLEQSRLCMELTRDIDSEELYFMQDKHTQKYILENISSYKNEKEKPIKEIHVGDVLLDEGYGTELLPAERDQKHAVEKREKTLHPIEQYNRLLRIKELKDDGAAVAILHQNYRYVNEDTVEYTENEQIVEVEYGVPFTVYSKYRVYDAAEQPSYLFVIYKEGERVIRENQTKEKPKQEAEVLSEETLYFQCHNCGYQMTDTVKRKYCPDCGEAFQAEDIRLLEEE